LLYGCIERYNFVIKNKQRALVVEGFVSDVSYNQTLDYPSDGRYFTVKLSYTSDVVNLRGEVISGASVKLLSDSSDEWLYTENTENPGEYLILDKDFKVQPNREYKLQIRLLEEQIYESDWQQLPQQNRSPIGEVSFEESSQYLYQYVAGEKVVRNEPGIDVFITVPKNNVGKTIYYKWDVVPTWIYEVNSVVPNRVCWITNQYYLSNYFLQEDVKGGYTKKLFFEKTTSNERLIWGMSLLINQQILNEDYYQYLVELKKQGADQLFDAPPFNLKTNLHAVDEDAKVVGYFALVNENAIRWYFNTKDLSYRIEDPYDKDCKNPNGVGGPICGDCLAYPNGRATLSKPSWWEDQ